LREKSMTCSGYEPSPSLPAREAAGLISLTFFPTLASSR
jgi:hypothetical protein